MKLEAIQIKQRRAQTMARKNTSDFALIHNDEVLDAKQKNYVKLNGRVKKEVQLKQQKVIERRSKYVQ